MLSIISLIIIVAFSMLMTKVAAMALMHTGLSRQAADFQARSAFTGVGYTTTEAEKIVEHPIRRRIVMMLMLVGNIGIVSVMASLLLTFVKNQGDEMEWYHRTLIIGGSIGVLWAIARSQTIDKFLSRTINRLLQRYTDLNVRDYASLMQLHGEYSINELGIDEDNWLCGKTLSESRVSREGISVIGIQKSNGRYVGAPGGDTRIMDGDLLIIYGRSSALANLGKRQKGNKGDREHNAGVRVQNRISSEESEKMKEEETEREEREKKKGKGGN